MTLNKLACAVTGSALFLLTAAAHAASHHKIVFIGQYDQDADGRVSSVEFETARRTRFDLTDESHDGAVDAEEYVFEYENRLDAQLARDRKEQVSQTATRFAALDTDSDAQLTRPEYDASGRWSWTRFDSNADGVIDAADKDPMAADIIRSDNERSREQILHDTQRVLNMPSTHNLEGTYMQYDLDESGNITRAEFDRQRAENFMRMDSSGDGRVSEEEYTFEFEDRLDQQLGTTRKRQVEQTLVRFNALDGNADRSMTFAEYQFSGHRSFTRYDTDGDGHVTLEEAAPVAPEFSQQVIDAEQKNI